MKTHVKSLLIIAALAATPLVVHAQDATKPATTDKAKAAAPNFEEFRKRMEERIKTSLKVTDDEWTILQPLIEKVTEKQRDASGGRSFGGFGSTRTGGTTGGAPAAPGASTSGRPERAGTAEREALRMALEDETTSPDQIRSKLGAVRAVRMKSTEELATAREELKKVVTVRQEAVLVSMGILE